MQEFLKFYVKKNISQSTLKGLLYSDDVFNKIEKISKKYNMGMIEVMINVYLNKIIISFNIEKSKIEILNNIRNEIESEFLNTFSFFEKIPLTKTDLVNSFEYLFKLNTDQFNEIIKVFQTGDLFKEKNIAKVIILKELFYENNKK